MSEQIEKKGVLAWFAQNHVAANLLMGLILAAGLLTIFTIKIEIFPDTTLDMVSITVPYRGASPAEVEDGVVLRIEEAVAGVDGVKQINATAVEGAAMVMVEVEEYADTQDVLDNIKAEVDRITTFPVETEKPIISEVISRNEVLTIVAFGDASERTLKEVAQDVHDDLTAKDNISQADMTGTRPYEISIEISERALRKYNLSFDQVVSAVGLSSLDVPGGSVKTSGGEILIRTKGQKYTGPEFEKIVVVTRSDGTEIKLGNIATVKDAFEDTDASSRFDGESAASVKVFRVGDQGALDIAGTVKEYIKDKSQRLSKGIKLAVWDDRSIILKSRINLLEKNASYGLILVFLCLVTFLDIRLAFWTTMGIPISFMGAFWLLPLFGVSINMISLFAFIMCLGLVVDDAIVVGENIFSYRQQGLSRVDSAIKGVKEMVSPVTMAVLTTVFAFVPLLYTSGIMGKILRVIPIVVISVLMVSLVEACLILPAHLSGKGSRRENKSLIGQRIEKIHRYVNTRLQNFIYGRFNRFVAWIVRWRYVTLACGLAILLTILGIVKGGYIKIVFFPKVDADNMLATLTMPQGTPIEQTNEVVKRLENAARRVQSEYDAEHQGPSIINHIAATIGQQPSLRGGGPGSVQPSGISSAHLAEVNVELLGGEQRDISSEELKNRWRDIVGEIPGISSLKFISSIFAAGEDINVELAHEDFDTLIAAAEQLKDYLREYAGVSDISDSFEEGKAELKLSLTDDGRTLGLTLSDLARQVRQGFYGAEIQRVARGREDIRVMVRYPEDERKSVADIENMRIRLANGTEIPFNIVANVEYGRGYASIKRVDRRRVVNVTGDVDEKTANAGEINVDLAQRVLPQLMLEYHGLQYRFAGEQKERNDSMASLGRNFIIALLAIYGLLAVQFRSYFQPLIVMSAIPFGIVGAVLGHLLLGFNLSILSMFGIVALSGVVVNDSLIMIDLINRERSEHIALKKVIQDSATRRFRPIMLTTLTTFLGLAPMMLERSLQARFLIPMAISLAFGVLFATCITLLLVPALYMILEDVKCKLFGLAEEEKD